jgi:hypothetical protein
MKWFMIAAVVLAALWVCQRAEAQWCSGGCPVPAVVAQPAPVVVAPAPRVFIPRVQVQMIPAQYEGSTYTWERRGILLPRWHYRWSHTYRVGGQ